MNHPIFIIAGAAIMDVLARPVNPSVFRTGSIPAKGITMRTGGDAMNEAKALSSLGNPVRLISKLGRDTAGDTIMAECTMSHIDTSCIRRSGDIPTSVNIVLVDDQGERHFITSPRGTLRNLYPEDIPDSALEGSKFFCFASIFVSPFFDNAALTDLFRRVKDQKMTLCADMTKCKNKETLADMKECLSLLDYVFPNYEEAALLTGETDLDDIADAFLQCGVKHVVIKNGSRGCFIKTNQERWEIPAYSGAKCIDTTGAGDTFTACFLHALGKNFSLPDCGRFANAGASICIENLGACGAGNDINVILKRAGLEE